MFLYPLRNHVKTIIEHLGGKEKAAQKTGLSSRTIRRYAGKGVTPRQYRNLLKRAEENGNVVTNLILKVKLYLV